uniref:Uncharacterized protein n=1 Tax=Arundo donax TaxID=35708 RepID=A0A0A8Y6B1_ARUDO
MEIICMLSKTLTSHLVTKVRSQYTIARPN